MLWGFIVILKMNNHKNTGWIVAGILLLIMLSYGVYLFGYDRGEKDLIEQISVTGRIPINQINPQTNESITIETSFQELQNIGYSQCIRDSNG